MDQGQLSRFRSAILAGNNLQPSTSQVNVTPSTAGAIGNLQNLAKSSLQGNFAGISSGAAGAAGSAMGDQAHANAKMNLSNERDNLGNLIQQRNDLLDPTKYRQEIDQNGGYNFYDPQGNKIDVKQYSAGTGKHITDILKKSQNPNDQEFVKNYSNVEKLGQIFQSGSKAQKDKFLKENPDVQGDYDLLQKKLGRDPTYGDIVGAFRSGYPQFFNTQTSVAPQQTTYGNETLNNLQG